MDDIHIKPTEMYKRKIMKIYIYIYIYEERERDRERERRDKNVGSPFFQTDECMPEHIFENIVSTTELPKGT